MAVRGEPAHKRSAPDSVDAVDIALATVNAGTSPSEPAAEVLRAHQSLIRHQIHEARARRLWYLLLIAVVGGLVAALAATAIAASRTSSLVVEPFRVPPALVQRGLTGEVIAARLLDDLGRMQAATESARAASRYSNNWEKDVDVALPQTGVSIGQLWRFLKGWLGNEIRISGELAYAGDSVLRLTSRTSAGVASSFEAPAEELDRLVMQAAESVYRATQPYRYSVYVGGRGRADERESVLLELARHSDPQERKWGYSGLSTHRRRQGRMQEALFFAQRAAAIDPDMTTALGNWGGVYESLGQSEAARKLFSRLVRTAERQPSIAPSEAVSIAITKAELAAEGGAFIDVPPMLGPMALLWPAGASVDARVQIAQAVARLHRPREAVAIARNAVRWQSRQDPRPIGDLQTGYALLWTAIAAGDREAIRAGIARITRATEAVTKDPYFGPEMRIRTLTQTRPALAQGAAALGDVTAARRLLAPTPLDCDRCTIARARVAASAGELDEAQRLYAETIRLAPSLPMAYYEQGMLLHSQGRQLEADRLFQAARRRAPRWADPLKALGDSALADGRVRQALRQYSRAVELAPQWAGLRIALGDALQRERRSARACEQWIQATRLEMSDGERARLQRRMEHC